MTRALMVMLIASGATGCSPTVQVAPPTEPITINLNVKIDHEVKVKVDRDLEEVFNKDSNLF